MTRTVGVAVLLVGFSLLGGWPWVLSAKGQSAASFNLSERPNLPGQEAYHASNAPSLQNGAVPPPNSVFKLVVEVELGAGASKEVCSGTFVGRHQVLTAGHCGCADPKTYVVHADGRAFGVRGVVLYDPRICASPDVSGRDLALLDTDTDLDCHGGDELEASSTLPQGSSCKVRAGSPAEMVADQFNTPGTQGHIIESVWSLSNRLSVGQSLVAVGYGLDENGRYGARLMANIPILSFACEDAWLRYFCAPFAEMVLADKSSVRARDTCPGDSGGPVYLFGKDNNHVQLVAIVSRAAPLPQNARNCGGGGIYELIGRQSVINWLSANNVPDKTIIPDAPGAALEIPPEAMAKFRKDLERLRN